MRKQVQKITGWLQMLLLLPFAALIIIDWKDIPQVLKAIISRGKYLNMNTGNSVDVSVDVVNLDNNLVPVVNFSNKTLFRPQAAPATQQQE